MRGLGGGAEVFCEVPLDICLRNYKRTLLIGVFFGVKIVAEERTDRNIKQLSGICLAYVIKRVGVIFNDRRKKGVVYRNLLVVSYNGFDILRRVRRNGPCAYAREENDKQAENEALSAAPFAPRTRLYADRLRRLRGLRRRLCGRVGRLCGVVGFILRRLLLRHGSFGRRRSFRL